MSGWAGMMKPAGRRLIFMTSQIGRIASTCRHYRSSGQDRATDQALRASEGITWLIMGSRAATDRPWFFKQKCAASAWQGGARQMVV
jgi:hypothetical protein